MKRDQKKWCISFFISLYFCLFSHPIFSIDRSKPPQSGPPPQIKLAKPTTFKLKNGLTVIIVENHKLPSVFIRLDIDNPPHIEGKLAGVSTLLSNMMGNGTKKIPKDKFNEDIDFMGATLRLSSKGGTASCLTRFYPKIMAMMSDAIINPTLTESEMIKEKDKLIESLKADEKNVKAIGTRVAAALIYGKTHPFGEYSTVETIETIQLKHIKKYHKTYVRPNQAFLTIVGDVNPNETKKMVKRLYHKWKSKKIPLTTYPEVKNSPKTEILMVDMPNAVQSEIFIANVYDLQMNHPDYFSLKLANQILGGSATARLFMNLREDKGYTYGSYSSASTNRYKARFLATASVRSAVTAASITEIVNEINQIRNEFVLKKELSAVKEKYIGNFIMATERAATIADFELNKNKYRLPDNFYKNYPSHIQNVSISDIKKATTQYFLAENLKIIVIGNAAKITPQLENSPYKISFYDTYGNPTD